LKDSNDNSEKIPGSIPFGSNVPVATRAIWSTVSVSLWWYLYLMRPKPAYITHLYNNILLVYIQILIVQHIAYVKKACMLKTKKNICVCPLFRLIKFTNWYCYISKQFILLYVSNTSSRALIVNHYKTLYELSNISISDGLII
jgi:hypothetical protein